MGDNVQWPKRVRVTANDYAYDGFFNAVVRKRSSALRVVVEDEHGRLFIHNPAQCRFLDHMNGMRLDDFLAGKDAPTP